MNLKRILCCVLLLLTLLAVGCENNTGDPSSAVLPAPTEMKLEILSTGDSDCILISADGYTILCDLADRDDYELIEAKLREWDVKKIDCIYLTHYDKDHIGSVSAILRDFKVDEIVGPNYQSKTSEYAELMTYIKSRKMELRRLTASERKNYGALSVEVNAPSKQYYADENDYSLILTLRYGDISFLLCGDAMKERLTEALPALGGHYDLVKLPHHGEYNKAVESLIKSVTPAYAVSCVASKGEVEAKLVSLLSRYGVKNYATSEGGVSIVSDGKTLSVSAD